MPPANQKWPEHGAGAQVETRVAEKLTSDPQLTSGKLLAGGPRVLIESGSTGREPSVEYSSGVRSLFGDSLTPSNRSLGVRFWSCPSNDHEPLTPGLLAHLRFEDGWGGCQGGLTTELEDMVGAL